MHFSAFSRAAPLLETDFQPFSAHWAFCLSPFLATSDWLLLYQECSPAYPGQQHCPELGPCDLYHKIWFIFVLFFYVLPLFPLLLSLHCWEAVWPGTLNTFILCYTSPSLFVMQGVREICDLAQSEKQPIATSVWMRSFRQNSALWKAMGSWDPTRLSVLQTTRFLGKVWVPFLARVWVIPVQTLRSYPMDS